jgi:hypothetical protein
MPTSSYYIANPANRCEEALITYISTSFSGSGLLYSGSLFFTGYGQEDKDGPAVIVTCNGYNEVYFNSRVYGMDVDITSKEIAWDSTTSSFRDFSGNINALFGDSKKSITTINSLTDDFCAYQIQIQQHTATRMEDAWVSTLSLRIVGAIK